MTRNPVWITLDGPEPGPRTEAFLKETAPYGVILFARHLKSAAQVNELCQCVHEALAPEPPKIALDQEGGRVNRLAALGYSFPGASDLDGETERTRSLASEMAGLLKDLGFDVDFAPVADLGPAFQGTGLEGRLYGEDPMVVTACCRAFLAGLAKAGVAGCLKHFPGLGGSRVDSHRALPEMPGDEEERAPHLEPYRRLSKNVPYAMVAHGSYEFLDSTVPSSLDPRSYELLRSLGFKGYSVTDDLKMGALSGTAELSSLVLSSLSAGASLALWVSSQEESLSTLAAVSDQEVFLASRSRLGHPRGREAKP